MAEIEVRQGLAGKRPAPSEWASAIGWGSQSEDQARWLAQSGFLSASETRALMKLQGLSGRARAAFEHVQLQDELETSDEQRENAPNIGSPERRRSASQSAQKFMTVAVLQGVPEKGALLGKGIFLLKR